MESGSIAEELGLQAGDRVVSVDGAPVRDLIDWRFMESEEYLDLVVARADGDVWELELEKDFDQTLGVDFGENCFPNPINCANNCLFCFVDQMPDNMRASLYVKDDDYRRSFWDGTFITLTNLSEGQMERIARQRLSPLYISVHATNPALRERLLGNKRAGEVLAQLRYLAEAEIEMHTQIVLCPGWNDGPELERSIADLAELWPFVQSIGVVPVGLTKFQKNRDLLRPFHREEARALVAWLEMKQEDFLARLDYPLVFAADEFYLMSDVPVPCAERYAGYPQLENGIGSTRIFMDEWQNKKILLPSKRSTLHVTIATSTLGAKVLGDVVGELNQVFGLEVFLTAIENHFFGGQVNVAGLITGSDLLEQLRPHSIGDLLVLPRVMLKKDEDVFLDGITLEQLAAELGIPVKIAGSPGELVEILVKE